jgi:hypothetical protein
MSMRRVAEDGAKPKVGICVATTCAMACAERRTRVAGNDVRGKLVLMLVHRTRSR